ncbi:MAG: hypothetical protein H0U63_07360 [Burkholderiales bacterium]|nr:hypothetical protein [Burkholderiales bacterium]
MCTFRKSIALLLITWLTIVGHLAVAMPFCGDANQQANLHTQRSEAESAPSTMGESAHKDCAQQEKNQNSHNKSDCQACGMCHMACHAVPPVARTLAASLPNRVYVSSAATAFLSFVPEQPQHVPLAIAL